MRVLVDTSALLALSRKQDQHHQRAVTLAGRHLSGGGSYVGTTLVLSELYSHLLYIRGSLPARAALMALLDDSMHSWLAVDGELIRDGVNNWIARYNDQRFSLVNAVSFEVMRRGKITHAFAFDRHFEIAGFQVLR